MGAEVDDEILAKMQEVIDDDVEYSFIILQHEWRYILENNLRVVVLERAERGLDHFIAWYKREVIRGGPV